MDTRLIGEIDYSTWPSNVVMVEKPNVKWGICTNYTDMNRACPNDAYPLLSIKHLIDGGSRTHDVEFFGCLFWLQSDNDGPQGQGKWHSLPNPQTFVIKSCVGWTEKRKSHIPVLDEQYFPGLACMKPKKFPPSTLKTHFSGFNLMLYF